MSKPACRLGDQANCPADSHGKNCCSHNVTGPAVTASPDVFINDKPALRVGDTGVHSSCCGSNTCASKAAPKSESTAFLWFGWATLPGTAAAWARWLKPAAMYLSNKAPFGG